VKGRVVDDVVLVLSDDDTVGTAVDDLSAGTELSYGGTTVVLGEDVPFGHKVAMCSHARGDPVRKYGEVIGTATTDVAVGEWVHTHNCESTRGRGDRAAAENGGETA
jgi:altronate dehydratase small subunit